MVPFSREASYLKGSCSLLVPSRTNTSYQSIWRTKIGNHLMDSAQRTGPSLGPAAGIFPHSARLPEEVSGTQRGPSYRDRSVTVYVPAPSLWHEPAISVPTEDDHPLKPEAEGDAHAGKREVPQSPQRPACRASLLPAAIPGGLRDLAARSRLRISPQGGRRQRDDLQARGGNRGWPRTPWGRAGRFVWGREAPRSLRAARRQLSRARTPREGAGGGTPLPGKAEV